ncbi:MAG: hypothetical protein NT075_03630 [Chloroflexi bacterium]|nr:hypothetical protein [Chloroflexota bacterium]
MSGLGSPALLLGTLLTIGYATLYHVWRGRNVRDLLLALLTAGLGFYVGQVIGALTNTALLQIGQLHVLEASLAAWIALLVMHLLQQNTTPS